jgi:hypothetical protein
MLLPTRAVSTMVQVAVAAFIFGFGGFALGAFYQYRHNLFLNGSEVGAHILVAKICAQTGCNDVRDWASSDLSLRLLNYESKYALLEAEFPKNYLAVAADTWRMRHFVDNAIKSPADFRRAIAECKCGLLVESESNEHRTVTTTATMTR